MFGIVGDFGYALAEILHAVGDDLQILFAAEAQGVSHVQQPRFAENGHDRSFGLQ